MIMNTYYNTASDCSVGVSAHTQPVCTLVGTFQRATQLALIGSTFARFIPRLCDTCVQVRHTALDCLHRILHTANLHKGLMRNYFDSAADALLEYRVDLDVNDTQRHLGAFA
jgi:hypothetical protein